MMSLSCKDMGAECDYTSTGETKEAVKSKMMDHAMSDHKDMMDKMDDSEKGKMMKIMDQKIVEA